MDEPQKHYAKLMKPDTKDYIMYNFIYVKNLGRTKIAHQYVARTRDRNGD